MDRIVIVIKSTRLDDLIKKHFTIGAVTFHLESIDSSIEPYIIEDATYKNALELITSQIPGEIPTAMVEREQLPTFLFRPTDFIIACGPDGLFVNLAQYVGDQLVLTINPDRSSVAGVLMLFNPAHVTEMIKKVKSNTCKVEALPMIKATVDNDKVLWGLNDILVGRNDHISCRYEIAYAGQNENQSSSGILISTGIGSTGWIQSIQNMLYGLTGNRSSRISNPPGATSQELLFVVREPFLSPNTGVSIVTGRIVPGRPLVITSQMPKGGCIFSDGITEKAIRWNAGSQVKITIGERSINRIVG